MLKRALILFSLLLPGLFLGFFTVVPRADIVFSIPVAHFYIVTFITFASAVISILLASSLGAEAQARHVLAAAAFAVIGSVFFSHGLATPNALIDHFHPAISWSAWLTLFGSGALFAVAGLDGAHGLPSWISVRRVVRVTVALVVIYSGIAAFIPNLLTEIENATDPIIRWVIFGVTLALWVFASLRLWLIWRDTHSNVDGVLAFVAVWLATATVSMHLYPVWNLSWWVYHVTLLLAFIIATLVLTQHYEQVRQFRLARYYLAASLILTALLALAASALFTQFAYNTVVAEVSQASTSMTNNLAINLGNDLSNVATAEDLGKLPLQSEMRGLLTRRVAGLPIIGTFLFGPDGFSDYASQPEWIDVKVDDVGSFQRALGGETVVVVRLATTKAVAYGPSSATDTVATFAPLRPRGKAEAAPIGVVETIQEAPSLNRATISARVTGLVTAALSMGLLFIALLSVVGRADRILTSRTEELRQVSAKLKTYSEWLLGKELLERLLADSNALGLNRQERTVLFMDIRGFTSWSEAHTPEEVVVMLNRYYNAIETAMTQSHAIKFKFVADETMGVFADAHDAARAALTLRQQIGDLLTPQKLGAGIGLHAGPLVEGLLGSVDVKFYDVIGDTVNTAKRIESSAARLEVLASAHTRQLLEPDFKFGPERKIAAKGKEEPVVVYPVLDE